MTRLPPPAPTSAKRRCSPPHWLSYTGVPDINAALATDPGFHKAIGEVVGRANATLALPERVRRFLIAGEPFSTANGQLTPTLKIRRHAIRDAYGAALDALYEGRGLAA